MSTEIHVVPVDDAHLDMDGFWVHHSFDKREQFERQGVIGSGWELKSEEDGTLVDIPNSEVSDAKRSKL